MAEHVVYSNADKLMAVVEVWSRPLVSQLPPPYSMLAPALTPVLRSMIKNVPDVCIPETANSIIDNAIMQGSVKIWKVTLDKSDLLELQRLIRLNLPCEQQSIGYEVKTK